MATFHCPNLTIIDESELNINDAGILGLAVAIKLPKHSIDEITTQNIHLTIYHQTQIHIPLHKISRFRDDYVIIAQSNVAATHIMAKNYLTIGTAILALLPWTIDYGSITLPIDSTMPTIQTPHPPFNPSSNKQQLAIHIEGLPPHLCCETVVHRLFNNICPITNIEFSDFDLSYSMTTYASDATIPNLAHVAIKTTNMGRHLLHIWPLWYEVTTEDMRPPGQQLIQQPADDEVNARYPVRYTLYQQPGHLNNPPHPQQHALIQRSPVQQTGTIRRQRNEPPEDDTSCNHRSNSQQGPTPKKMKLGEYSKAPAADYRTPSP